MAEIKVKLSDVVDALSSQSDEATHYLNKKTGEISFVRDDAIRAIEDEDPDIQENYGWEKEELDEARKVDENPDDYIALPDKFEIEEYKTMEDFCLSREDEKIREELYHAMKGRGAFGRFKDLIHELGIADDWYRFKNEAYERIAREWGEENHIQIQ